MIPVVSQGAKPFPSSPAHFGHISPEFNRQENCTLGAAFIAREKIFQSKLQAMNRDRATQFGRRVADANQRIRFGSAFRTNAL